jgi:hypothetical protein
VVDDQVPVDSLGCLNPPVTIRATRLSMDLTDGISEEHAPYFPVARVRGLVRYPKVDLFTPRTLVAFLME